MRHIAAYNEHENKDPESGLSHLAHAACCLLFLLEYEDTHPELDDRYDPYPKLGTLLTRKVRRSGMCGTRHIPFERYLEGDVWFCGSCDHRIGAYCHA